MAALNRGSEVTSGLKKVTADMKTKNRADRTGVLSVIWELQAGGSEFSSRQSISRSMFKTTIVACLHRRTQSTLR